MADRVGAPADRVVAVANATLGLVGAMAVSAASSWVLPSWTFTATAAAALQSGAPSVFGDVDARDWWLHDPGSRDRGVLRVAPFGDRVDATSWATDGDVVVDAAASLGQVDGSLNGLPRGAAVVFSVHATKVLPAGEGGLVVFGDPARAETFRAWSNFGFAGTRTSQQLGTNAKMSELTAACGLAALDDWAAEREDWKAARALADRVTRDAGLPGAPGQAGRISPYWIVVLPDRGTRDLAVRLLAEDGIATRCWWGDGCHRMPAYRDVPRSSLDVTERLAATTLGLPMFRGMTQHDAGRIERAFEKVRRRSGAW
jgi:dTDP-4-amino-4,6-dideoxygalactose transaminase